MTRSVLENLGGQIKYLGDYEIQRKLGEGGMGSVFLARQKSLDRLVALKVIAPSFAGNAGFIARFQREARAAGHLNHPNIVQGIDVARDETTGLWYFAMEYVNGPSVSRILKDGPIPEARALKIVQQIAAALEFAEKRGFVHRDIKPDNILLTASDDTKLADLGLAKHTGDDASLTQAGMAVGSPHYISPEQARGEKDIDIRTDIYSLGATLFHMVTGRTPFEGPTSAVIMVKHIQDEVPSARQFNPQVSEACSKLIARMTRRDRNQRIKTPGELLAKIELTLNPPREPARVRSENGERPRANARIENKKPGGLVFAGIATGVLALIVVAYFMTGKEGTDKKSDLSAHLPDANAARQARAPVNPDPVHEVALPAAASKVAMASPAPKAMQPAPAPAPLVSSPRVPVSPERDEIKPVEVVVAKEKEKDKEKEAAVLQASLDKDENIDKSKLNAYLDRFDAEAMKNRYPEAKRIAKDASADTALAAFARDVHDLENLAQALTAANDASMKTLQSLMDGKPHTFETRRSQESGVVEKVTQDQIWIRIDLGNNNVMQMPIKLIDMSDAQRKRLSGEYKPSTPSEHLAEALRALTAKDAVLAKLEAASAEGDSLAPRYAGKARDLEALLLEDKAAKAWKALRINAAPPANAQAAQEELKKIDEFESTFNQTRFAASIADTIRDARATAQKILGCISGICVARPPNNDFIAVKADGAREIERYIVDLKNADLVAAAGKVAVYRRIKLQWKENAGLKLVVGVEMLPPPDRPTGVMKGKVTDKSLLGFPYLEIQNEAGEYERFAPGKHGGDPRFPELISKVKVGDAVKVDWEFEMRYRLVKVE